MTPAERELIRQLCARIAVERDAGIFDDLVRTLKALLENTYSNDIHDT